MSRIGRLPIAVPSGVDVTIDGRTLTVKGPKGTLTRELHPDIAVAREDDQLVVTRPTEQKTHRQLHGLRDRLEVGRDRRAILGPYFKVKVPLVGVTVTVQRMWTRCSSEGVPTLWYGGALTQNQANIDQAWRTFVDTVPVAAGLQTNP